MESCLFLSPKLPILSARILPHTALELRTQRTVVCRDFRYYMQMYHHLKKKKKLKISHAHAHVPLPQLQGDPDWNHCSSKCAAFPLSKMVQFNVLKVTKAADNKKQLQQF
uniref:Uncharacterized protein n=1 Tax=Aquila chrysaetos chrysaetos TaxID=223781 RepID=A0A663F9C2_AQUCH